MKIAADTVVSLEYTLKDENGEIIDGSDGEPLEYLHGHGQLVPGLEKQLEGKKVGDKLKASVPAEEGYGTHDPERVVEVTRAELPEDLVPEIGMELSTEGPDGEPLTLWITDVTDTQVTLDGNHPLAGQTLHFDIDVRSIRAATKEELEHGHVHGEGDHEH
jgi:FKBP-type peptidyl-prolyl cis-trans isomerase SlyD